MTVEGEKDDISGVGQTYAAQELCVNIPEEKKLHYLQTEVGHYGVFNGSRFRKEIAPRIRKFIGAIDTPPAKPNGAKPNGAKAAACETGGKSTPRRDHRGPSSRLARELAVYRDQGFAARAALRDGKRLRRTRRRTARWADEQR